MPGGFLLDTNVISESRRLRPDPGVMAFITGAESNALFLSVLTIGELHRGVAMKRRTDPAAADQLAGWVDGIEAMFADRILGIDTATARLWGEWSAGRTMTVVDTLLAATASAQGLVLVTRNTRDVAATGVSLLNPWLGS